MPRLPYSSKELSNFCIGCDDIDGEPLIEMPEQSGEGMLGTSDQ